MNSLAKEIAERIEKIYLKSKSWTLAKQQAAALIDSALPKWVEVTPETMPKEGEDVFVIEKGGSRSALYAIDFEDMIEFQEGRYPYYFPVPDGPSKEAR